jgi:hypothetical protein
MTLSSPGAHLCGVSPELLARKVRQDCIRTIGSSTHAVDEFEVQRIERLVRALRSRWQRLRELGICRLHSRGRCGQEVVGWDVSRLIQVSQIVSSRKQEALFDEVGWACDGAGQRRFRESVENELSQWRRMADQKSRRAAQLLLTVFGHLPKTLAACRSEVSLIACGRTVKLF